jgi:hypothetical protein
VKRGVERAKWKQSSAVERAQPALAGGLEQEGMKRARRGESHAKTPPKRFLNPAPRPGPVFVTPCVFEKWI